MILGTAAVLVALLAFQISFRLQRSDFQQLFMVYSLWFGASIFVFFWAKGAKRIYFFVSVGILLRAITIFATPQLSDDVYRFLWDGRLWWQGFHPFEQMPFYFIDNQLLTDDISCYLFAHMNSPAYFTIYPPVCQAVFATATFFFKNDISAAIIGIKFFLFACEIGSILLIIRLLIFFKLPLRNVLLYALNPLAILEICGNAHFEGAMVFFLLAAIFFFVKIDDGERKKSAYYVFFTAFFLSLSVASKLLPLMFAPLFFFSVKERQNKFYFILSFASIIFLLFIPLYSAVFIQNFGKSLHLYFQQFEFNGSIFYVFRAVLRAFLGYNPIHFLGPLLAFTAVFIIAAISFRKQTDSRHWLQSLLFVTCTQLFFATIVHPWYVLLPLSLSIFTPWRFPIVWSATVFLTYSSYAALPFRENLWLVAIEYLLLAAFFLFEKIKFDTIKLDKTGQNPFF